MTPLPLNKVCGRASSFMSPYKCTKYIVNIYLGILFLVVLTDSSFLTEVFPHKKERKKNVPSESGTC